MPADCPCCQTSTNTPEHADWVTCPVCEHRWRPNSTTTEIGYYQSLVARNDTSTPWFKRKLAARTGTLQFFIDKGAQRILEIGCAEGLLGACLKSTQAICYDGIELSRDAAVAAAHLDNVFTIPASALNSPLYDLIISFHVLEHIGDIAAEVHSWLRLLGSEGVILIEVPNRAGHPLLMHDANREHLHQFSLASVACLLQRCGLEVEQISGGHHESPVYPDSLRIIAHRNVTSLTRRQRLLANFNARLGGSFAIYGIGGDFENYILPLLQDLPVIALLDSAPEKQGREVAGHRIATYAACTHGGTPILISSIRFCADIRRHLRSMDIPEHLIVGLDEIYELS